MTATTTATTTASMTAPQTGRSGRMGRLRRKAWRPLLAAALGGSLALGVAAPASAHLLTVDPRGTDVVVDGPVSRGWAQAHCHAEAPEQATESSDGVVAFSPAGALECPTGPGEGAPGRD